VLELSQELMKLKMNVAHIDTDLLSVLGASDVGEIMVFGANKINSLVETKLEVSLGVACIHVCIFVCMCVCMYT